MYKSTGPVNFTKATKRDGYRVVKKLQAIKELCAIVFLID
jgi:hypothetical protein